MKMKMDTCKKKRARGGDEDRTESKSHHRKCKHNIKNKASEHLRVDNNNDEIISSSSSFKINVSEGCSKNIDPRDEQQQEEEQVNNIDDEKSVFDFPWSKEADGGVVHVFENEDYCLELGLDTVTFSSCNSINNVIDPNLVCEMTGTLSNSLEFLPQQVNSDILDLKIGSSEPLTSSTFKVDELEGSDWINNLEQTNNTTVTTSATAAN